MMNDTATAGQTAMQVFTYEGSPVSFNPTGENIMVNATEMARPFGKATKDFLKLQQTKEFIQVLSEGKKILSTDLVKVRYGKNGCTWMHEDVAIEFARWLSPKFAIWCNDRIKELLRSGITAVTDDELIAHAMLLLKDRVTDYGNRLGQAEVDLAVMSRKLEIAKNIAANNKRLAEYAHNILATSETTYTFTQLARELGFRSVSELTFELRGRGLIEYDRGLHMWAPAPFLANVVPPHFATAHFRRYGTDGTAVDEPYLVVTERGREFLHRTLNASEPVIDLTRELEEELRL